METYHFSDWLNGWHFRVPFVLIVSNIRVMRKHFCGVNPIFFPPVLPKVFKFQTWMKDLHNVSARR
jgi:hypothetical protein